jgi:hypothetical protein
MVSGLSYAACVVSWFMSVIDRAHVEGVMGWLEITWQTHGLAWAGPVGGMEVPLHMEFLYMISLFSRSC